MKKQVSKVLMGIGLFIVLVGSIIDVFLAAELTEIAMSVGLLAIIGFGFCASKNDAYKLVGNGLIFINGISPILLLVEGGFSIAGLGALVMMVGAALFFLTRVLNFFGFNKNSTSEDPFNSLSALKGLKDENTLSEEEFELLKKKILESSKGICSIDELKKYKKLYDEQVITSEEFAQIKKNIL